MPTDDVRVGAATVAVRRVAAAVDALRECGPFDREAPVAVQVANALDPIYDLWELWVLGQQPPTGPNLKTEAQDRLITTSDGETAAGLSYARGAKSHGGVVFGRIHGFGEGPFGEGPFGGGWHWQKLPDETKSNLGTRAAWYRVHVYGRRPLVPIEIALRWFRDELGV